MFRNVAAVVLGLVIGGMVIFLVETLGHQIYPQPDLQTPVEIRNYLKTAPAGVHLLVLLSYVCGAFFTGLSATLIRKGIVMQEALIAGLILTLLTLVNLLALPGPVWFWVLAMLVHIPMCLLGYRMAAKIKRRHLTV